MATTEEVYRESQARLHKVLGSYLLVKAWDLKVDCVAIPRSTLLKFLNLQRMKNKRIDWLKEDLKTFFPYQWTTVTTGTDTYATLYVSRFRFPAGGKSGSMTDSKRVKHFTELGLKSKVIKVPDETEIYTKMALLSNGLSDPSEFDA
ncbi:hypothetical protein [Corallincola spongiicola]|uniref:Uncharacterized protein n=1 Tax=Corallincola spongiicola TaxID=2520508 RepID=A0ABY1WMG2_9GAMM|nr:hypothetical protein [Corallincola spongiicola]TAA43597.1 hypothetical protein EXY25_13655 [Corallincola spongiicola]